MMEMMMYSMSKTDEDDENISLGDFISEGGSEVGEADDEDMDSGDEDPEFEDEGSEFEDEDDGSPDQPQPVFGSGERIGISKTNAIHINRQESKYIHNSLCLCYFINVLAPK